MHPQIAINSQGGPVLPNANMKVTHFKRNNVQHNFPNRLAINEITQLSLGNSEKQRAVEGRQNIQVTVIEERVIGKCGMQRKAT